MAFSPSSGSVNTLIQLSGNSLFSVSGVYFTSGATGALATLVSTSTNLITFYPPAIPPSGIISGKWKIYNLFGNSTENNYFYYLQPVFLSGFQPHSGFTGSAVTFSGSGLQNVSGILFGDQYGTFNTPIFQNNTYIVTGFVPFYSGALSKFVDVTIFTPGGQSTLGSFYVMERGISLTGLNGFPTPIVPLNMLRSTAAADALEWRSFTQVREDINAMSKSGDIGTGNYTFTGGQVNLTGLSIYNSGLGSGNFTFNSILTGGYLILQAKLGGIQFICSSYKYV